MNVIAIANPKGGCGKTATAVNLAVCLGSKGLRVLLVDMDAQGHASLGLGVRPQTLRGMLELFTGTAGLFDAILSDVVNNVDLVPGNIGYADAAHLSISRAGRESLLYEHLTAAADFYDYVIVDCPSAFGALTINGLRAANRIVMPVALDPYAAQGVARLREMITSLCERYAAQVHVTLLPNMIDRRTRLGLSMLHELKARWPEELAPIEIRHAIKVKEAAQVGRSVFDYAPRSAAANDFNALAELMLGRSVPISAERTQRADAEPEPAPQRMPNLTFSESMGQDEGRHVVLSYHHLSNKDLQIAGDFNDWIPDYKIETRVVNDTLQKMLQVRPGSYQYRVIIDGKWQEDPANPVRVPNNFGGSNSLLRVIP